MARFVAVGVIVVAAIVCWRALGAWWSLDQGDLAFVRGDRATAAVWFARGLTLEPAWHALLEDHARAVMDLDPKTALVELQRADCGQPCIAEAGDAESRLDRAQAAVDDYLAAHAVERLATAVDRLSAQGRFDDAIALERALAARLGTGMLAQADLATAYFTIGVLDARAAERAGVRAADYRRDAIRSYRRASLLAPMHEDYLLSLGYAELQWGDRRAARAAFDRLLDLHPHEVDAERGLARLDAPQSDR